MFPCPTLGFWGAGHGWLLSLCLPSTLKAPGRGAPTSPRADSPPPPAKGPASTSHGGEGEGSRSLGADPEPGQLGREAWAGGRLSSGPLPGARAPFPAALGTAAVPCSPLPRPGIRNRPGTHASPVRGTGLPRQRVPEAGPSRAQRHGAPRRVPPGELSRSPPWGALAHVCQPPLPQPQPALQGSMHGGPVHLGPTGDRAPASMWLRAHCAMTARRSLSKTSLVCVN